MRIEKLTVGCMKDVGKLFVGGSDPANGTPYRLLHNQQIEGRKCIIFKHELRMVKRQQNKRFPTFKKSR